MMNPAKRQTGGQNSIENLVVIFFKYANAHVQRQCSTLVSSAQGQPAVSFGDNPALDGRRPAEEFKAGLAEALRKGPTRPCWPS